MKAKEEAKRLVDRFDEIMPIAPSEDVELIAKQCALICVDKILESINKISLKELRQTIETNDVLVQLSDLSEHWQQVKQEIDKL